MTKNVQKKIWKMEESEQHFEIREKEVKGWLKMCWARVATTLDFHTLQHYFCSLRVDPDECLST